MFQATGLLQWRWQDILILFLLCNCGEEGGNGEGLLYCCRCWEWRKGTSRRRKIVVKGEEKCGDGVSGKIIMREGEVWRGCMGEERDVTEGQMCEGCNFRWDYKEWSLRGLWVMRRKCEDAGKWCSNGKSKKAVGGDENERNVRDCKGRKLHAWQELCLLI